MPHDMPKETSTSARTRQLSRKTRETQISVSVNLDGCGEATVSTGVGFFDHMLDHLARHGMLDLAVKATGDLHIDAHHTVEDVSLVLGSAIQQALGDKRGIYRYGWASVPMEDTLANVALDLSGRPADVLFFPMFPPHTPDPLWRRLRRQWPPHHRDNCRGPYVVPPEATAAQCHNQTAFPPSHSPWTYCVKE